MERIKWPIILLGLLVTASCSSENGSDAFGQFEADEVVISSETNGRLLNFDLEEGQRFEEGEHVALIDTTQLHLQKEEVNASIEAIRTNIDKLNAQKAVFESQLETARKELSRFESLQEDNAATQQQLDSAEGRVQTLERQIESVEVGKGSVSAEVRRMGTKIAQINDQIERASITNPVSGTVLNKFAEEHELISQGKPLYSIANLDVMVLRVYISGAQLPAIQLGETVDVIFDENKADNQNTRGRVSWIASEAEFTPRMIQTKQERVTQVYAVKVRVDNPDGKLKIGMPGEVRFESDASENE
ncbi:HlyD family secretion protein [Rhodohalobacter sulfatireducens]|uniref:HlyD family efflux transporter periplasmic adaptor subunit n=1 Tax=Rhodohalobacter sulfatireducens TaxID=2911366 RepID=A0ABS9KIG5_9BACT|nr:HlyD family efflux transporter periplasmic adaptor subunit [Rhodohalobacter sulfatireducens]MCG2590644.1 HlyD family efflux transporter periplasmic adaptor subunit [Rhodohalobacter sulfatireducens]